MFAAFLSAGAVTVDSILDNFDFSIHPSVTSGDLTVQQATTEMMEAFSYGTNTNIIQLFF